MFGNRMQTSAIPERVYALCREVASKLMDENSLKLLLEPQNLGGKTPYFGIVTGIFVSSSIFSFSSSIFSLFMLLT